MPRAAKLFIALVLVSGTYCFCSAMNHFSGRNETEFPLYLALALMAAGLKVKVPKLNGSMSVNFPFILLSIAFLDPAQTMLVGCSSICLQCFVKVKKGFSRVQTLFNIANVALAVQVAQLAYHSHFLQPIPAARLFVAALVYFVLNTMNVAIVIALTQSKRPDEVWVEFFFWSYPYYLFSAAVALFIHRMALQYGLVAVLAIVPVAYAIYHAYNAYFGRLEDQRNHAEQIAELHLRTIEALALAIEAKDQTTHQHLNRVRKYACALADRLGIEGQEKDAVRAASLLHDIGKLAVPEHIISKPGRLTPEEFDKMKIHPVVGADILKTVEFPYPVVPIVRAHHERWDGTGYPDGLKGEEIPMGARIISIVDCFDAIASDRQYRKALPPDQAIKFVEELAGKAFDPKVTSAFVELYRELEKAGEHDIHQRPELVTKIVVSRGMQPATGFESAAPRLDKESTESALDRIAAARQEVQTLYELAQDLGNSLRLEDALRVLESRIRTLIPFDSLAVFTLRGESLNCCFAAGVDKEWLLELKPAMAEGVVGWVVANERSILNGNPAVEGHDPAHAAVLKAALAVPMKGPRGMRAALAVYSCQTDRFDRDHQRILQALSSKLAVTVENSLQFQLAEHNAATDFLTGLPNARSLFLHLDHEIARADREHSSVAIAVCDLDGFKRINDVYGHLEGNSILVEVARSLRDACRPYDYVARMGGDEFVVVISGIEREQMEERLALLESEVGSLSKRKPTASGLTVSIGAAVYPVDGTSAEELLASADAKMYGHKVERRVNRSSAQQYPACDPAVVQ